MPSASDHRAWPFACVGENATLAMKIKPLTGQDRKRAIEARTTAVWEGSPKLTQHQRRYQPRAYGSRAGNWHVFDVDEGRALTDDDLLRISPRRLIETPCRSATLPAQSQAPSHAKRS